MIEWLKSEIEKFKGSLQYEANKGAYYKLLECLEKAEEFEKNLIDKLCCEFCKDNPNLSFDCDECDNSIIKIKEEFHKKELVE